jgi:dTDP-4-amino-4,6-dideoxygalactose transaminase
VIRNQGMRARYEYELVGHNYRMTDLAAAVALPQLARYPEQVQRRRANAARLTERLRGLPGLVLPEVLPGREHVWHQYTVQVTEETRLDRAALAAALAERGVGSGVYYPKLAFDYACYAQHPLVTRAETPVAARVAAQCLSLPVHAALTEDDVDRIVDSVADVLS